ncbi:hypothetical protein DRN86_01725 [Candidatus Geothermarchaeota archaeon]|nr:MAG: hypothetical protein DRN86_01725 [Candidatus Geothermarchaeota archaeon]
MKFKPQVYLFPFMLSLITLISHRVLISIENQIPELRIIPEPYAPLDAVVFLTLTILSSLVLLLILKQSKVLLRLILTFIILILTFLTTSIYREATLQAIGLNLLPPYGLCIDVLITVTMALSILYKLNIVHSIILFLTMVGIGCLLDFSIPSFSTKIVLLIIYSAFDVFSAYKGFLKHFFKLSSRDAFSIFLIKIDKLAVGSGDIILYSMILSLSLDFGMIAFMMVFLGISTGFFIDLRVLSRYKMIPGLPIPVALSLIGLLIYNLLFS